MPRRRPDGNGRLLMRRFALRSLCLGHGPSEASKFLRLALLPAPLALHLIETVVERWGVLGTQDTQRADGLLLLDKSGRLVLGGEHRPLCHGITEYRGGDSNRETETVLRQDRAAGNGRKIRDSLESLVDRGQTVSEGLALHVKGAQPKGSADVQQAPSEEAVISEGRGDVLKRPRESQRRLVLDALQGHKAG